MRGPHLIGLTFCASLVAMMGLAGCAATAESGVRTPTSMARRSEQCAGYLKIAKAYANALIEHGTDTYGSVHSGMLLSIMDRSTLRPYSSMPKAPSGVRSGDRVTSHGSNVNVDQNVYRVLYTLTKITGDAKYAKAADSALAKFLEVTSHPKTKFLAWGEHLCWNLKTDTWAGKIHEPKRPTVLFDKFYELNPQAIIEYSEALWEHQISDHESGNFSRHARYDKHGPQKNNDYPKEGGYFINDWARAYQKSGKSDFLKYIDVLASRYLRKLNATPWNIVEFDARKDRHFQDTSASISLAIECHDSAQRVPAGRLRDKLLKLAEGIDIGLQALPHDVGGRGFAEYITTNDYKLLDRKGNGGYSFTWGMKYGRKTTSMLGILFYRRCTQLDDGATRDKYRQMALHAADKYLSSDPDIDTRPWPVEVGMAAFLQLAAHEMTGTKTYLDRAKHFADLGISTYWPDDSPLPKADPACDHYENVTRADTLAYALLKIYAIENSLPVNIGVSDIDR